MQLALVASIVTMLALAMAACGKPDTKRTVPAGAKPNDLKLEPCTFKTKAGKYAADCGTLVVPENRGKADSRLIALPVMRIRATSGNSVAPIFWLEGGPGMSNMKFKPPAWLLTQHDFVMVGYRGADGSAVLNCPEAAEELLPKLARGKQVILREMGHTQDVWNVQPQAHLLTSFYDTGAADDSRFAYAPMDFKVAWGFPLLVKLLLGVGLLIVAAVVAVIWFIARRG
jgi:hypothetical protein